MLQISGARERSAITSWIVEQSIDARNALDELPSLPIGTAYIWSPRWLRYWHGRKSLLVRAPEIELLLH